MGVYSVAARAIAPVPYLLYSRKFVHLSLYGVSIAFARVD